MRFDPTLIVNRVVIKRNAHTAYDELFHSGVNIIRGDNSSGKSTILNFIFYGLGGDLYDWSEHAALCTHVIIEVEINGMTATLRRDVSVERGQPMNIFGGSYEASAAAPIEEWVRYPYARSQSMESFSQALFRLLGIPEVANELSGNITMHQILRLLYADQLSPVEHLFKFEKSFDSPIIRDAVGRLLSGAYDSNLYQNELAIRADQREYDAISGELRSLYAVLGSAGQSVTLDWIHAERSKLDQELASLQAETEEAERDAFLQVREDRLTLRAVEEAYNSVQALQAAIGEAKKERDSIAFQMADSAAFITSLRAKIDALTDAAAVADHIGGVEFHSCPSCFAALEAVDDVPRFACRLCKTPFDTERSKERIVALINDTALQIRQSERLQEHRERRVRELDERLSQLQSEWSRAARDLSALQRAPVSEDQDRVRRLHRRAGYLESQIEHLGVQERVVEQIDKLRNRARELNDRINWLTSQNEAIRASQKKRLAEAYTAIADEIRTLLRNDLRRQDSFENPESVEFDFGANRISVDGRTYFSASSRAILKSSFFLGFFAAATKMSYFRHPRFCILDTIEDKGMEPQRSYNFQLQIARVSKDSRVDHQIIYATTMIAPQLDEPEFTIGKFSTRDDPTLAIAS